MQLRVCRRASIWLIAILLLSTCTQHIALRTHSLLVAQVRAPTKVGKWEMWEATLKSSRRYFNPFTEVTIIATFRSPSGKVHEVEGFYDGGQTWKVRFLSLIHI